MALLQALKSLVNKSINKRLSAAAAEEIFEIVGRIRTKLSAPSRRLRDNADYWIWF